MKTIKQVKKQYSLTDEDISKVFGYKNKLSYYLSSARPRIEKAICKLESLFTDANT